MRPYHCPSSHFLVAKMSYFGKRLDEEINGKTESSNLQVRHHCTMYRKDLTIAT